MRKLTGKFAVTLFVAVFLVVSICPQNSYAAANKKLKLTFSKASATTVTLKWNKVPAAKKYVVYKAKGKKKMKKYKTIKAGKTLKLKCKKLSEKSAYRFYVKAYLKNGSAVKSNTRTKVRVRGNYSKGTSWGDNLTKKQRKYVKNKVAYLVNCKLNGSMTQVQKLKTIFMWMRKNTEYSNHTKHYYDAYGLLHDGYATCWGFARAFKAICDGAGIQSKIVYANKNALSPNHAWNMVKVGKKWYVMDTQINTYIIYDLYCYDSFLIGQENQNYKWFYSNYKNRKKLPTVSKTDYKFTVVFKGSKGQKFTRKVKCGGEAEVPELQQIFDDERLFAGWDKSPKNIWSNMVINAKYERLDSQKMIEYVNKYRRENGLSEFVQNDLYDRVAYKTAKQDYEGTTHYVNDWAYLNSEGITPKNPKILCYELVDYEYTIETELDTFLDEDYLLDPDCTEMGIGYYHGRYALILN